MTDAIQWLGIMIQTERLNGFPEEDDRLIMDGSWEQLTNPRGRETDRGADASDRGARRTRPPKAHHLNGLIRFLSALKDAIFSSVAHPTAALPRGP